MKSLEAQFAEALEQLKKASASKYNTVFDECQKLSTLERKLNCVEAALKGTVKESANSLKLENIDEAKRDFGVLFGVEPKTTTTNNESAPIKKHNGAVENFVEGSPFNGDRGNVITGNNTPNNVCAKGDRVMFDGLLQLGKITEAEHKKLTGNKPEGYEKLSEQQRKEFDFCRAIGISEADSFRLTKIAGSTFKEVGRR